MSIAVDIRMIFTRQFLFCFIVLLAYMNVSYATGSELRELKNRLTFEHNQLSQKIQSLDIPTVSPHRIRKAVKFLQERLYLRGLILSEYNDRTIDFLAFESTTKMASEIDIISEQLIQANRILVLTDSFKNAFSLENSLHGQKLKGMYLPLTDTILVDSTLNDNDFAFSLFHELTHALQYKIRFPFDMNILLQLHQDGILANNNISDFLSYIYEAQANWYELVLSQPTIWQTQLKDRFNILNYEQLRSTILDSGESVNSYYFNTRGFRAQMMRDAYFNAKKDGSAVPLETINSGINAIDYLLTASPSATMSFFDSLLIRLSKNSFSPFLFQELIMDTPIKNSNDLDFDFVKNFRESMESTYFKDQPTAFRGPTQGIFSHLNDQFYQRYIFSSVSDMFASQKNICPYFRLYFRLPKERKLSPLLFWMTTDRKDIARCIEATEKPSFDIKKFQEEALKFFYSRGKSPFTIINLRGTEGGGGGLEILPRLLMHPQLEILPRGQQK